MKHEVLFIQYALKLNHLKNSVLAEFLRSHQYSAVPVNIAELFLQEQILHRTQIDDIIETMALAATEEMGAENSLDVDGTVTLTMSGKILWQQCPPVDAVDGKDAGVPEMIPSAIDEAPDILPSGADGREADTRTAATNDETAAEFKDGDVILGKYRILQKLGRGGMGVVYKVQHTMLENKNIFALKMILPQYASNETVYKRFVREVELTMTLLHRNIITVREFGSLPNDMPYMVMDFVDGKSLQDLLKDNWQRDLKRSVAIARQLLEGLKEAHNHNIVHRDIKPANLILTVEHGQECVKILDFGLAKLTENISGDESLTQGILGTPMYMAPEQALAQDVDHRADLYTCGLILYEMLFDASVLEGKNSSKVLRSQQETPAQLIPGLPNVINDIIVKATAQDPRHRYQSAQDFIVALDLAMASLANKPEPITLGGKKVAKPIKVIELQPVEIKTRKFRLERKNETREMESAIPSPAKIQERNKAGQEEKNIPDPEKQAGQPLLEPDEQPLPEQDEMPEQEVAEPTATMEQPFLQELSASPSASDILRELNELMPTGENEDDDEEVIFDEQSGQEPAAQSSPAKRQFMPQARQNTKRRPVTVVDDIPEPVIQAIGDEKKQPPVGEKKASLDTKRRKADGVTDKIAVAAAPASAAAPPGDKKVLAGDRKTTKKLARQKQRIKILAIGSACVLVLVIIACLCFWPSSNTGDLEHSALPPRTPKVAAKGWFAEILPAGMSKTEARGEYMWEKDGSLMVYVPEGPFWRGDDNIGKENERPLRQLVISAFYIDKYELSNEHYLKFIYNTGHSGNSYLENANFNRVSQPVVGITWQDAKDYADWVGKRLPSEAEWEKAARGGVQVPDWQNLAINGVNMIANPFPRRRYPWGNDAPTSARTNSSLPLDGYIYTAPIGSLPDGVSPYLCHDMAGNVWEWCHDTYQAGYYQTAANKDPMAPATGEKDKKVCRGGSWRNSGEDLYTFHRNAVALTDRHPYLGVRLAR